MRTTRKQVAHISGILIFDDTQDCLAIDRRTRTLSDHYTPRCTLVESVSTLV